MACSRCGNQSCWSVHSCPNCSKPIKYGLTREEAKASREAGEALGRGLVDGMLWLATSPVLAYVYVFVALTGGMVWIDTQSGWIQEAGEKTPTWFAVLGLIGPLSFCILFRRPIRKVVPMVLGGIVHTAVFALYAFFVCGLIYAAYKMLS